MVHLLIGVILISRSSNQKLKILYLYKILFEETDESHPLNASELISKLASYGVSAERKSIYDDIEALQLFGVDIISEKGTRGGYYIGERQFEVSEIKMLTDIIQSAKFISENKSMKLIEKFSSLTSIWERSKLKHEIILAGRAKSPNENVYYNIDSIYRGISEKKQISFKYYTWDVRKNKLYRNKGNLYFVNPISLIWDDEKYYLVAYDDFSGKLKHYRVDKMESVSLCQEAISRPARELNFDSAEYSNKNFNMFSGETDEVTLKCKIDAVGIIFDRFGRDVFIVPKEDGYCTVTVKVAISPQFYSWIFGLNNLIVIEGPDAVREEYINVCKSAIEFCS